MEDVLDIVVILELLQKLFESLTLFGGDLLVVGRDTLELGADNLYPFVLKEFLDIGELLERAVDQPFLLVCLQLGVQIHQLQLELIVVQVARFDMENALVVEQEREGALGSQ